MATISIVYAQVNRGHYKLRSVHLKIKLELLESKAQTTFQYSRQVMTVSSIIRYLIIQHKTVQIYLASMLAEQALGMCSKSSRSLS